MTIFETLCCQPRLLVVMLPCATAVDGTVDGTGASRF